MQRVKIIPLLLLAILVAGCGAGNTSPASTAPAADENAALDALKKTNEAQALHFKINRRYALTYDELLESRLLNAAPAAESGYDFRLRPAADAQSYRLIATPAGNAAAARHFFTDQTGVIRAETGKEATAASAELK
jgi:hypothetical protein